MSQQDHIVPPPLPVPPQQQSGHPLSLADYEKLEQASIRAKKIRKVASLAAFNGYTFAICASFAGIFAIVSLTGSPDYPGIIISAGLGVIAYNEFKGRRMILDFDSRAAKLLGWNQIALVLLIIGYCAWNIFSAYSGHGAYESEIASNPELKEFFGPEMNELAKRFTLLFYGLIIVVSVIFQGINSVYYFTRKKLIDEYVACTPRWVMEVQKRASK